MKNKELTSPKQDGQKKEIKRRGKTLKKATRYFTVYCTDWLEKNQYRVRKSTQAKYNTIVNRHIRPWFGNCLLKEITTEEIMHFTEILLYDKSLAPKTVKDILVVLHTLLLHAKKFEIKPLPAVEIIYPHEKRSEMRVLTLHEQGILVQYLLETMDPSRFGVLLALMTGIRLGELCALKWSNISIEDQILHITATMQRIQNPEAADTDYERTMVLIDEPKSGTSLRVIPLMDAIMPLFRMMDPGCEDAYVLTGCRCYMEPRTMQNHLQRYVRECGLKDIHFHTLRHTFATRCVEVGFDIKSLSEILGHANTNITLNRYVHVSMDLKRSNMEKLSAISF